MHEYHLLERLLKEALADNQNEVLEIILAVSDSSGLDPGSLKLYFQQIQEAEPNLKNAKLSVDLVKTILHCAKCNLDFERIEKSFLCPKCCAESGRSTLQKDIFIKNLKFKN